MNTDKWVWLFLNRRTFVFLNIMGIWLAIFVDAIFWWYIPLELLAVIIVLTIHRILEDGEISAYVELQDSPSKHGVYFLDIIDPDTGEITHGKIGHGNVQSRIRQHQTLSPLKVRGVIYCQDKQTSYQLEQRILQQLASARQIIPNDGRETRAVELYRADTKAYEIIDSVLKKVGVTPNEHHRLDA